MQQAQLQAGSTFNRYEIQSRLAVGGMAEVWLGWLRGPEGFQKQVVLKTMLPHLAESPDLVQMFINEASVAARLNHPNIAQVFDFGEYDGRYFIAMEYLVGRTLRQIAKRCRDRAEHLPMWFLLRVLCDACEGLHYAHEYTDPTGWLGLVHRDVSPENVMVSNAGQVKVLDFGAAHCTSSSGQTRMFVGKFHYVAPERIQGMPEDRRADIYSTGVILYEYLTGTRPFAGTQTEVLAQVMAGKLAESAKLALLDGEIVRILRKAMAKDPDHRYQTAAELRSDLLQFLAATDPHKLQAELSHYTSIFPELKARFDQSEMRLRASTPAQIDPLAYLEQSGSDSEALQLEIEVDDDDLMVTAEAPIASVGRAAGETVRPQTTAETVRPHQIAAETVRPEAPEIDELFARLWDSPGVANVESEPEPEPAAEGGGVASDREASSAVSIYDKFSGRLRRGADERGSIFDVASPHRSYFRASTAWGDKSTGPSFVSTRPSPEHAFGGSRPVERSTVQRPLGAPAKTEGSKGSKAAAEHFEKGLRLLRDQEYEQAERAWELALEIDPHNRSYQSNLRRLRKLMIERDGSSGVRARSNDKKPARHEK